MKQLLRTEKMPEQRQQSTHNYMLVLHDAGSAAVGNNRSVDSAHDLCIAYLAGFAAMFCSYQDIGTDNDTDTGPFIDHMTDAANAYFQRRN